MANHACKHGCASKKVKQKSCTGGGALLASRTLLHGRAPEIESLCRVTQLAKHVCMAMYPTQKFCTASHAFLHDHVSLNIS